VRGGRTALDAHHIERAVEGSLKRLGTDYIDLYQTHWPDPELPIEVTLEALDRVIRSGKVRYIGASNETAYGLTKALYTAKSQGLPKYQTIQNNFSLLNRRFEEAIPRGGLRKKRDVGNAHHAAALACEVQGLPQSRDFAVHRGRRFLLCETRNHVPLDLRRGSGLPP